MRLFTTLLLAFLLGCAHPDPADLAALNNIVAQRRQAITTHDTQLYLTLLSPAYNFKGLDYSAKTREITNTLSGSAPIAYRNEAQKITISGNTAVISGRYLLRTTVKGNEMVLQGTEEIQLRKEAGVWKITGGV